MRLIILLLLLFPTSQMFAQSKKEIKEKGISVIKTFEQDVAQGEKKMLIEKEEYFNSEGELIEVKKINEKGKMKSWDKFIFNEKGLIKEEQKLNYKGTVVERVEHKYKDGIRIEKIYFDEKNRVVKKKKYEYQFKK